MIALVDSSVGETRVSIEALRRNIRKNLPRPLVERISSVIQISKGLQRGMLSIGTKSKFSLEKPSDQLAVDIFKGRWASRLPDTDGPLVAGTAQLFSSDPRPGYALRAFRNTTDGMKGAKILELGPLEGGHTYQLEGYGADIVAVEGNAEGYLKCLIAKEIYGMRARFLFGNFLEYLESNETAFDMIFASGVLYHMTNPTHAIELICRSSPRTFVWMHYYDGTRCRNYTRVEKEINGAKVAHYVNSYSGRGGGRFWGGLEDHACWLEKKDILNAFRRHGHEHIEIVEEEPDHENGPAFSFITSMKALEG
jgi:hypothetical protein